MYSVFFGVFIDIGISLNYFSEHMLNKDLVSNINIKEMSSLISPEDFKMKYPVPESLLKKIRSHREDIQSVLNGKDSRMLAVMGPCSIHDYDSALEYAGKLRELQDKVSGDFLVIMRVYFEKPRTTIGWKGLITDPDMDGTFKISEGLSKARKIMLDIAALGLPIGSEILDPVIPQYIGDLISWASIGARTTESQVHREIASGLSMPVGFKNSTDGQFSKALNAIESARHPHSFIGIDEKGMTSVCRTRGNAYCHLILRGGDHGPNYHIETIEKVESEMTKNSIDPAIIVDCSHANSGKNPVRQGRVLQSIIDSRKKGHASIKGFMIESHLKEGNQAIPEDLSQLIYGLSITDSCLGWDNTENCILKAIEDLRS